MRRTMAIEPMVFSMRRRVRVSRRNNEAELILGAGNFYQTDNQFNLGGHTNRFAYYASANGNRTNLGLQTPTSSVIHDAANGYGGFTSLIYNANSKDQLQLIASRRDFYQVPFDPNDPTRKVDFPEGCKPRDRFLRYFFVVTHLQSWIDVPPSPSTPIARITRAALWICRVPQRRGVHQKYEGGQLSISWVKGHNNLRAGLYGFAQQDSQRFGPDLQNKQQHPTLDPPDVESPAGSLIAPYIEDQLKVTSSLTSKRRHSSNTLFGRLVEIQTAPASVHLSASRS